MATHYDFDSLRKAQLSAYRIRDHGGKRYYKVPVRVLFNSSRQCRTLAVKIVQVIATSAAAAADLVRDEYLWRPETEIEAYGPRGGLVQRYVGYHSHIASEIFAAPAGRPLALDLEGAA